MRRRVLGTICNEITQEVIAPRDYTKACDLVLSMQKKDQLNETALLAFAEARKYEETVAALALLCRASIETIKPAMKAAKPDGLPIPCKAAGGDAPHFVAIGDCDRGSICCYSRRTRTDQVIQQ